MNQTIGLETLQELYDEWFDARLKSFDKLEEIKAKIDDIVKHIKGYIFTHPEYWIISLGHDLMLDNINEAKVSLDQLDQLKDKLEDKYIFYYYFFKCSYYLATENLNEAQRNLQLTKENLKFCQYQADKADFYYKLGTFYYNLKKTIDSTHNISTSLALFKTQEGYNKRISACEMALGLNSIDIHQWEEAEEHLYNALNYANKDEDVSLKAIIYHNLGLLYAEQNLSKAAIHWLVESAKYRNPSYKTCYLICRENYKLDKIEEAEKWYDLGHELAENQSNKIYMTRFELLKTLFQEEDKQIVEEVMVEGIKLFLSNELWTYVEENSKRLAEFYTRHRKYEKAVIYYELFTKAQEKRFEMEALK